MSFQTVTTNRQKHLEVKLKSTPNAVEPSCIHVTLDLLEGLMFSLLA